MEREGREFPQPAINQSISLHRLTAPKSHRRLPEQQKKSKYSLFFLNSGFPFFTDATTISPTPASGSLFSRAPKPYGSIRNKLFAPLLSAQLSTAPTGRPRVKRNFVPEAPPPKESSSIRVNHEVDVAYRELLPLLIGIR